MQILDHLPVKTIPPPAAVDERAAQTNRRLVVLVSDSEMDAPAVARRILDIAEAFHSPILFLGLCSDKLQESSLRRQLVILSAMVRDEALAFETRIEIGKDWVNLVRSNSREGDVFVCFSRQTAGQRGSMYHSLLQSDFASTVYVLDDLIPTEQGRAPWLSSALAWTGSILIILGFLWLQVNALPLPNHAVSALTLMLSIPIEVWMILGWNSLFEIR
ncbi:MAG: hypothetical protein HY867_11310 [Chloroflexi bacterium]|nr:hypothetical protein [Chloroflexota bacterium]